MMKSAIGAGLAAIAAGVAAIVWVTQESAAATGFLPYEDAEVIAAGEALYVEFCASCHGAALEGQEDWRERDGEGYLPAPPHDATGHTWHHPDGQLFEITKLGTEAIVGNGYRSRMSGFGDVMTDDEIVAVLAYIKSTWPEQVIEMHNGINDRSN